ncbi:unnamed protein product [Microthlaspi erraticum]|uniref:Uncharacterized protein n=1 Tax=Microthlaspi erraticum TaxID=1685480 RepID=A0A6D2IRU8_9BRAS|nr:unnamed protein product [Microthlaspi erraticum]
MTRRDAFGFVMTSHSRHRPVRIRSDELQRRSDVMRGAFLGAASASSVVLGEAARQGGPSNVGNDLEYLLIENEHCGDAWRSVSHDSPFLPGLVIDRSIISARGDS